MPLHKGQDHVGSHRVTSTACRGHHPGLWTLCGQRTVRAVRVFSNTPLHYTLCINRGRRLPLQLSPERFMLHSTMILQILLEPRSSNASAMIVAFIERQFFSSSVVWYLYCPVFHICEDRSLCFYFIVLSSTIYCLSLHLEQESSNLTLIQYPFPHSVFFMFKNAFYLMKIPIHILSERVLIIFAFKRGLNCLPFPVPLVSRPLD